MPERNPPPGPKKGFWSESQWYGAQVIHILAAASIVWVGSDHGWHPWTVFMWMILAATIKEFVVDLSPFEGDTLWGSTQDFFFYACGAFSGLTGHKDFWWGVAMASSSVLFVFLVDLWDNACLPQNGEWLPWRQVIFGLSPKDFHDL